MLKKILIALGVVVVLIVAAAVVIPMVVPVETYKDEITKQVRTATGRDLAINGAIDLSVIPTTALTVSDVTFSNMPGGKAEHMARFKQLDIEVKLLPLLSGRLELDRLVLVEPVINLEKNAQGQPNWQFKAQASAEGDTQAGRDAGAEGGGAAGGGPGLEQIQLGDVRLVDGVITYTDLAAGTSETFEDVDVAVSLPNLQSPLDVNGDLTWNGEDIALEAHVEEPDSVLAGETSAVRYSLDSTKVTSSFDGTLTNSAVLEAAGDFKLDVPSVRELAAWVGSPLDAKEGTFGPLNISGRLSAQGPKVSFANAQVAFDDIEGTGAVAVDTSGAVPYVDATLDLASLNLNPYIGEPAEGGAAGDGAGADSGSAANGSGGAAAQDWSTEPIDVSALRSVNADAELSAEAIQFQEIKVDRGAITVKLSGGKLTLDLTELALYGGRGKAQLVVDGSGGTLGVAAPSLSLAGLAAKPFLTDAAGFSDLSGTANFQASNLRASGNTQKSLVSSLAGNGSFEFVDGALEGTNLALALRQITSLGKAEAQATDFARISGTFNIANGIVTQNDLQMQSQLLRVEGAGVLPLPPKTVDYKITPKGVLSLEGQGGATEIGGVVVPVRLHGPWHNVQNEPVWSEMKVIGPEGELNPASLQNLPEGIKDKIPSGVLDRLPGLLGGGEGGAGTTPEDAVKGVLEGVTGGKSEGGATEEGGSGGGIELPGGIKLPGQD